MTAGTFSNPHPAAPDTPSVAPGCYELYGLTVASSCPLPGIRYSREQVPDVTLEWHSPRPTAPAAVDWIYHWYTAAGKRWRSCARQPDGYLLRFYQLADFELLTADRRILCHPLPGIPLETLRHLVLDQVIPLCLSRYGREAIHASAVVTPWGACCFVGETGSGKSTLAASLSTVGCRVLCDDCLAVQETDEWIVAIPAYSGFRLWPLSAEALFGNAHSHPYVAHYNQKRRVAADSACWAGSLPLRALFVLNPPGDGDSAVGDLADGDLADDHDEREPDGDAWLRGISSAGVARSRTGRIVIQRLSPAEALTELLRHSFRLDVTDRKRVERQFQLVCRLVGQSPVYRLAFPREFSRLPEVHQAVLDCLRDLVPSQSA